MNPRSFLKNFAFAVSAGALGGLANGLVVWFLGAAGMTAALGVAIAPEMTPAWLYPRLVWGGLWGGLLLLPLLSNAPLKRGLLFGLGPACVQLFIVFPYKAEKGMAGLALGEMTPLVVVFVNLVWGVVAAIAYRSVREKATP